jgi:hypothetical protein
MSDHGSVAGYLLNSIDADLKRPDDITNPFDVDNCTIHTALAPFYFSRFFNFQSPFKILNSDSNLTRAKLAIIGLDCTALFGFEAVGNRESSA